MSKKLAGLFQSSNLAFGVFIVLAFSLAWNTAKVIQRNHGLQQQVDKLKDEISLLELQNENLRLNIEYQKTDDYLELEAREKFNKAAPGERVVYLEKRESEAQAAAGTTIEQPSDDQGSNLYQWLFFLFGYRRDG